MGVRKYDKKAISAMGKNTQNSDLNIDCGVPGRDPVGEGEDSLPAKTPESGKKKKRSHKKNENAP